MYGVGGYVDQPSGKALDTYAMERRKGELTYLTSVNLAEGENVVRLKLVGKNAASSRLAFDLMKVVLERER